MDKDGNGTISLSEYFGIFEEHGVNLTQNECNRSASLQVHKTKPVATKQEGKDPPTMIQGSEVGWR